MSTNTPSNLGLKNSEVFGAIGSILDALSDKKEFPNAIKKSGIALIKSAKTIKPTDKVILIGGLTALVGLIVWASKR